MPGTLPPLPIRLHCITLNQGEKYEFINIQYRQSSTSVHNSFLKTCTKVKCKKVEQQTHVITEVPLLLLKKYIKIHIYRQQTKRLYQQLRHIQALIQLRVTVNVLAITRVNVLHNSDGNITDGQRNSQAIRKLNNVV